MTPEDAVAAVQAGDKTFAIGALRATSEMYSKVKFSYSTFDTGLQLLVRKTSRTTLWLLFEPFGPMLWGSIFVTCFAMAHIMWVLERGKDSEFPMTYVKGIKESLWHSFSSFFFTGDKEIRTIPGRIMQISFWFMAFVLFASYTATLTTRLSIPITETSISDYEDIDGKEVGSWAVYQDILEEYGADVSTFREKDIENAVDRLKDGDYDAIALDSAIVTYHASQDCDLTVAGEVFVPFYYVMMFPLDTNPEFINSINDSTVKLQ
jgi:ABC-type amino acid transport substrate-binding protein